LACRKFRASSIPRRRARVFSTRLPRIARSRPLHESTEVMLITHEIMAGFSATDVIETARRWRADCVFIGAEEVSFFERMLFGDPVASVAARAECSVVPASPIHVPRCPTFFSLDLASEMTLSPNYRPASRRHLPNALSDHGQRGRQILRAN